MKILVVSMLRLGDLIMAAQSLVAIRKIYPDADIHLLTNRSNLPIAKLINGVTRVHYFERELCQKSLGEENRSVFEATDRIDDLIKRLNKYEFDKVINLTQNRISAHLSGMVNATEYHGMITSENNVVHLSSPWFRHLNNYIAGKGTDAFHYVDLFRSALGFEEKWSEADVFIQPKTRAFSEHKNKIVVQAWSSDEKKDYSISNWRKYFTHLASIRPNTEVVVLGAPNERQRLNSFLKDIGDPGIKIEPAILTFEELLDYLPRQSCVVSVDTSIKHLAGAIGMRVIELALGSSDPRKTGVYSEGSIVIKSRVDCAPCSHIKTCSKASYLCEESIDPEMLSMVTHEYLRGSWPSLRVLAEEYRENTYIGRVGFTQSGLWFTQSLHPVEWQREKESLVNLESWRFTLNRKYLELSPPFQKVAHSLAPTLMDPQKLMVERLESVSRQTEMNVDRVARQVHDAVKDLAVGDISDNKEVLRELRALESDLGLGDYLSRYVHSISAQGISSIRSLRESINELRNFQVTKTNILRSIHNMNKEEQV